MKQTCIKLQSDRMLLIDLLLNLHIVTADLLDISEIELMLFFHMIKHLEHYLKIASQIVRFYFTV